MNTAMTRTRAEMATMAILAARVAAHEAEAGVPNQGPRESRRTLGHHRTTQGILPTALDEGAGRGHVPPHKTTTGHDRRHLLRGLRRGAWSTTDLAWLGLIGLGVRSLASQPQQRTPSQASTRRSVLVLFFCVCVRKSGSS